jgi:hypothetical protein
MNLSRRQTALLKRIGQRRVIRTNKNNVDDLVYLYDLGLISVVSCPKEDDYYFEASGLTEKGKAVLDERILYYRDRRVPHVALGLSVAAILISLAALVLQFLGLSLAPFSG